MIRHRVTITVDKNLEGFEHDDESCWVKVKNYKGNINMNEYYNMNMDEFADAVDNNISYSEYITDQVDNNISYSEYITEQVDNNISYSEYILNNYNCSDIVVSFMVKNKFLIDINNIKYDCEDILIELNDIGIKTEVEHKDRFTFQDNTILITIRSNDKDEIVEEVVDRLTDYMSKYK